MSRHLLRDTIGRQLEAKDVVRVPRVHLHTEPFLLVRGQYGITCAIASRRRYMTDLARSARDVPNPNSPVRVDISSS